MAPTRRCLWLMTALLPVAALPILAGPNLAFVLVGAWIALSLLAVFDMLALVPARVGAEATVPAEVGVGDSAEVRLRVLLGGKRRLAARLLAEPSGVLVAEEETRAALAAGESEHVLSLSAPERGTGGLGAAWFSLDGPFGLVRRTQRVALEPNEISVVPNARRVRNFVIEHFGTRSVQGGLHSTAGFIGSGGELDALVGYVPGMDLRDMDWKATARHQALTVRRYRPDRNQRVVISLDVGRLMRDPIDGLSRLDHGVHAALLIAYAALTAGDLVGLHAYGAAPERFVPPAGGLKHLERLRHGAASLESRAEETNHFLGLRDLLGHLKRRSLVIVVTDFVDATGAELMIENLAHLARKHLVVFVALDDPVLEAAFDQVPAHIEDVGNAVVAASLRNDRRKVILRLRRAGVDVIHGPPHRATLDLLSHYVRIKRRGRIG